MLTLFPYLSRIKPDFYNVKILVIEDEKDLLKAIKNSLEKEHYVVETAEEYYEALDKLFVYDYDCILLDIMLPNGSGLEIMEELKSAGKRENVIIVSAKDSLDDKLKGLDLGADDYLTKPFHLAELNARVKAVLRRKQLDGKNTIEIGNAVLDLDNRELRIGGDMVVLNRKEFDILNYFMLNKNRLVSKMALAEHVWGDHTDQADNFDFIYYQIKNLRKRLQEAQANFEIQAVYGIGYKLGEP
ncbi:response regulator with CheY-like receiver domain and winged-helix DNA-binding domain [Echinicola vietnamensis DSM 17526]|uniref:Response regulator with CheY-like receiver domain and winged-helix DNA-binding domain n=1 Tax=Echinicola vietnamensis (strain DSM 17526 / LMG 23754 / KMM 6221) TaxID=926556 RepID=L0G4L7_ECHVK|nr:response regulator with CheY-like receiver domain and winged-helix DNA-binding domain [Echinicola vietnamensis DSM 17526]